MSNYVFVKNEANNVIAIHALKPGFTEKERDEFIHAVYKSGLRHQFVNGTPIPVDLRDVTQGLREWAEREEKAEARFIADPEDTT